MRTQKRVWEAGVGGRDLVGSDELVSTGVFDLSQHQMALRLRDPSTTLVI